MDSVGQEQDRQVVVASEDLRLVLGQLGGRATVEDADARLGLTLVQLADVYAIGRDLEDERRRLHPTAAVPDAKSDLDRVLLNLRVLNEQRFDGWTPTMGKNRTMTGIQFSPYANAGSFDRPRPAGPVSRPHTLPRADRGVRVGLMDTRLDQHSHLAGRYVADDDALLQPDTRPAEGRLWWEGHATFIAGIVLAKAPAADLDVRTALGEDARNGRWTLPVWQFAERLAAYRDSGVSVLNLSLGCSTDDGKPPMVLERAIAQLTPHIVVVAAAGNHGAPELDDATRKAEGLPGPCATLFPAALDGVLAVGALDGDAPAIFNPRNGADRTQPAPWIDVFAPGVDVTSTYLGDPDGADVRMPGKDGAREPFRGYATWSGTSFAAGDITGAVAAKIAEGKRPQEAVAEVRAERGPR